jgi:N2-citryl-N6-acetyl-N6-hydroxylysine synthase
MHPWQADYLLEQDWCQRLAENGSLQDLGEAGAQWLPTSSSRSLYSETNSDMIKFSLSVRLTNSVRTLSVKEVKRGCAWRVWRKRNAGRIYRHATRPCA